MPTPHSTLPAQRPPAEEARWQRLLSYAQADPHNASLLAELVDVALQQGRAEQALAWAERECALPGASPQSTPAAYYRHAVALLFNGQAQASAAALRALLAQGIDGLGLRRSLAQACSHLHDWAGVVDALLPLYVPPAQPQPGLAEVDLSLVRALHHLGRLDDATQWAEHILQQRPSEPVADALGTLYLDTQRLDEATALYGARLQQGRATAELDALGGYVALAQGELAAAQQRFAASIAQGPSGAHGRAALGQGLAHAVQGDLAQAQAQLRQAVALMPEHLGTRHALAWMQLLAGDTAGARATFEEALARNRNFADSHGGLGLVALVEGRMAEAREHARAGLKLDPNSLNSGLAMMQARTGQRLDFSRPEFAQQGMQLFVQQFLAKDPQRAQVMTQMMQAAARARGGAAQGR